jgi:succinoglycan biosynthesis transport protein ExoP
MITRRAEKSSLPAGQRAVPVDPYSQLLLNRLRDGVPGPSALQVVGLTGCSTGAGVSTVSANLAIAGAQAGLATLLVDANWRRPSLHKRFQVPRTPGLGEVLLAGLHWESALVALSLSGLGLLPVGDAGDLAAATGVSGLAELLIQLRERFDLVVIDLPCVSPAESTLQWTSLLDGVLLVLEAERDHEETARRASKTLRDARAQVLGAVLNKRREHLPRWLDRRL